MKREFWVEVGVVLLVADLGSVLSSFVIVTSLRCDERDGRFAVEELEGSDGPFVVLLFVMTCCFLFFLSFLSDLVFFAGASATLVRGMKSALRVSAGVSGSAWTISGPEIADLFCEALSCACCAFLDFRSERFCRRSAAAVPLVFSRLGARSVESLFESAVFSTSRFLL